jgi:O-antigen/teichoic acid export membrane protein
MLRRLAGDSLFKMVAGGAVVSLFIKVTSAGLTYLMFAMLARAMTVEEFGRFSFAFSLASFLAVAASLGLHTGIMRWIPEFTSKGQPEIARGSLRWATLVTIAVSCLVAITTAAICFAAPIKGPRDFLYAGAALIIPMACAEFVGSALRAKGSVVWSQMPRDVLWRAIVLALAGGAIASRYDLGAFASLVFAGGALTAMLLPQIVLLRGDLLSTDRPRLPDVATTRSWMRELIPYWGIAAIYASTQYVDVVLVGSLVSTNDAGAYFAAARTAGLGGLMLVASNMVSAPLISAAYHSGDKERLAKIMRIVSACISLPTLCVVILAATLGRDLLGLFDAQYVSAYYALMILVVAQSFNSFCGPMSYVLQLTGHGNINLAIIAGSYALGLVVQIVLIPGMGVTGAAIGSALAIILWNTVSYKVCLDRVGVDPTILSLFRRPKL